MRDGLVLPDGPVEDDALLGVLDRALEGGPPDAHGLDADHDTLGIEGVDQVIEAVAHRADHVGLGHLEVVDEDLVGVHGGAAELLDQAHRDGLAVELGEEERHALERPGGIAVARAREEQDAIGVLRVGGPHLAPVDEPAIALLLCPRLDARGVGARVGLGDAEGHHGLARHDLRELALLELVRPVAHHGLGWEAVEVDGRGARGAGARGADLVEHEGGLGDAQARAAIGLGNHEPEPAVVGEGLDELRRVFGLPVFLEPVVQGEGPSKRGDFLADQLLLLGEREVHRGLPAGL